MIPTLNSRLDLVQSFSKSDHTVLVWAPRLDLVQSFSKSDHTVLVWAPNGKIKTVTDDVDQNTNVNTDSGTVHTQKQFKIHSTFDYTGNGH